MTALPHELWTWEQVDPNVGGGSGNFAKLLQNQQDKKPGFLADGAPSPNAYFLAREVIQNAWDAALELRKSTPRRENRAVPDFEIAFSFRSIRGEAKRSFVRRAGLREHAQRLQGIANRSVLGLPEGLSLDSLDEEGDLPILMIEETGTTGMYGPWRGAASKLYQALGSLGVTPKTGGEGGSYGYGKSGLIKGSRVRVLIAYTCFAERPEDPGVTRRLLGVTYWGTHQFADTDYTGMARLHQGNALQGARPFENDEADAIAEALGFNVRSPEEPEDQGSAFCLVEPTVRAEELVTAINRYWWPAIEDQRLRFRAVVRHGDQSIHPRPKQSPELRSFVTAYEEATTPPRKDVGRNPYARRHEVLGSNGGPRLGVLSLVASKQWSFPDPEDEEARPSDESLVALMRKPRMVIEYLPLKQRGEDPPIVRGVFVADDVLNDHLRRTEPFGHDAWKEDGDDAPPESRAHAREINRRIRNLMRKFRRDLKPPPPPKERTRLPEWDRIMRTILQGEGPPRPPTAPRDVSIQIPEFRRTQLADGRIFAHGRVTFGFTANFPADRNEALVKTWLRVVVVEADGMGEGLSLRSVLPPSGFSAEQADLWVGSLTRAGATLSFETKPYPADWTVRLIAGADLAEDEP